MNKISIFVLVVFSILSISCQNGVEEPLDSSGIKTIETFDDITQNGVQVSFSLQEDEAANQYLSARFAPLEPGYYLYGNELPEEGIKGLGVPTSLKVLSSNGVEANEKVIPDQEAYTLKVEFLDIEMPVYEVGPVTLSLPIEMESDKAQVELELSYMACNKADGTCLPPVRNKKHVITF